MNKTVKIIIVAALIGAVGVVIAFKDEGKETVSEVVVAAETGVNEVPVPGPVVSAEADTNVMPVSEPLVIENQETTIEEAAVVLPRLVDLGAGKCVPCKMMAPILEELKGQYAGKLEVIFIDVWENPDEGKKYGIKLIPTQIFYDASGKELFRHEGFFSKEDILGKWKELGVTIEK